jgi:hypothetical protein
MFTATQADGSISLAASVGSFYLAATGTQEFPGKVALDLATQCRPFVE